MQTKFLANVALFSSLSLAQLNVDPGLLSKASNDVNKAIATMKADLTRTVDLGPIESAAPDPVLAAASHDTSVLLAQLAIATTTPEWFSKLPTSIVNAFVTDFAAPNKAKQEFNNYISSAAAQPEGKSLLKAVYAAAPTSIQSLYKDPMGVVTALEASATPLWASNIPTPLWQSVGAVYNGALRAYESNLRPTKTREQFAYGTGASGFSPSGSEYPKTCPSCPSCTPVTVYATITAAHGQPSSQSGSSTVVPSMASSKSVVASTPSSSKSVIAFTGASAPMRTAAAGVAALVAGAGAWLNV